MFGAVVMNRFAVNIIEYIANYFGVSPSCVEKLGVVYSVASPRGYAVMLDGKAILKVKVNRATKYVTCDHKTPCGYREISTKDMLGLLAKVAAQRTDRASGIVVPDGECWVSGDYIEFNGWEGYNCFTNCRLIMRNAGFFRSSNGRVNYEAGEIIEIPYHLQTEETRPLVSDIAFVQYYR